MYITHKKRYSTITDTCKKLEYLTNKYRIPIQIIWDGEDDILVPMQANPNSHRFDLEEQFYKDLEYLRLNPLIKFLRG